ncbi:dCTP deaminase, partial [bacterium]|nr:dCTP deaminase [bacterium]
VDLRLDSCLRIPKENIQAAIRPSDSPITDTLESFTESYELKKNHPYNLEPHNFILAQTFEEIKLPIIPDENGHFLSARIEGKSSRARLGMLVHFTAPTIHAGFNGHITLEVINLSNRDILLYPEIKICQLIFEQVLGEPEKNPSQFQNQSHPTGSH